MVSKCCQLYKNKLNGIDEIGLITNISTLALDINLKAFVTYKYNCIKVFNSKEVGEVQEGADCYSARKLSKHSKG